MDNLYKDYIRSSAEYCLLLFQASEQFFKANSAVERAVAHDSDASFSDEFNQCSQGFQRCLTLLEDFRQIHIQYPNPRVEVDFCKQNENLTKAAQHTQIVAELFSSDKNSSTGEQLQQQIWDDDSYTYNFIAAARAICAAISWQCDFAELANLQ